NNQTCLVSEITAVYHQKDDHRIRDTSIIAVVNVYINPTRLREDKVHVMETIAKLKRNPRYSDIIMTGDWNLKVKAMDNFLMKKGYGLHRVPMVGYTRIGRSSATTIDHFAALKVNYCDPKVLGYAGISDHLPITIKLPTENLINKKVVESIDATSIKE